MTLKKIIAATMVASALAGVAGTGATQKWVSMKLAEQATNTTEQISSATNAVSERLLSDLTNSVQSVIVTRIETSTNTIYTAGQLTVIVGK